MLIQKHLQVKIVCPVCFFLMLIGRSYAQSLAADSSRFGFMTTVAYSLQIPGGDLQDRFGVSSSIGGSFILKTKRRWLVGLEWNYIFGNTVREDSLLKNIITSNGFIIGQNGEPVEARLLERGWSFYGLAGKMLPPLKSLPCTGLLFNLKGGFFQHRIRIETSAEVPQLSGEYKKGYDRLANGFSLSEFAGLYYFGNKRMVNFVCGLESVQAWTQGRRGYNYDLMAPDNEKRFDLLYCIKASWLVSLYKRKPDEYYYH